MRLIQAKLLPMQQVVPYAPLESKRVDFDAEPVAGIIKHLKSTGRLVLQRDPSAEQVHLFQTNQSLAQRGYCGCTIKLAAAPKRWISVTAPLWPSSVLSPARSRRWRVSKRCTTCSTGVISSGGAASSNRSAPAANGLP
jgi:hypothetical protein